MIVCSCNEISCREIADAVDGLMVEDPVRVLTPAQVYRRLEKRPKCGGCLAHAAELVHKRAACLRGCHRCTCRHPHRDGCTVGRAAAGMNSVAAE